MKLKRICPICECKNGELLHSVNFAKDNNEYIPQHYDVVVCDNCGFIFNNTDWTQKEYDKYYKSSNKHSTKYTFSGGSINNNLDIIRYDGIIKKIEKLINKENSILDVGCGQGGLLKTLKDNGYNNLYGIDPSNTSIDILKSYDINGESISLFELNKLNQKFDVVILSQVLEHIYDLGQLKLLIKNLLNENAILYIDVPDGTSYIKNQLSSFYYFDLEHINHFSRTTISYLFNDLNVIDINSDKIMSPSNIDTYIIYAIFTNNFIKDNIGYDSIKKYINYSIEKDTYNNIILDNSKNTYLWGLGAHLRRLLLDEKYFNNINISGIIDKNIKFENLNIVDCRGNHINVYTPDILNKYPDSNIIITSVLYYETIKKELISNDKFKGNIYKLN